jgi:hypothetical protein
MSPSSSDRDGQRWTLTPQGDDTFALTNDRTGMKRLDVYNAQKRAYMNDLEEDGNVPKPGQSWSIKLVKVKTAKADA